VSPRPEAETHREELGLGAPHAGDGAAEAAPETRCIRRGADDYPAALLDLAKPPDEIHVRGALPSGARTVAIVGSRAATAYGLERAGRLAADLARLGLVIVSGLARGIDAAAHRGALEAGGITVAVLPGGLDAITPTSHVGLARRIAGRGALLSEWPGAHAASRGLFIRRNRLIAALAQATVVVEAAERSGALSTALLARRLGRPLLAVPGDVDRVTSRGCNALLREGARFCENAADVLRVLPPASAAESAGSDEARLAAALAARPLAAETLAATAGVAIDRALAGLLRLEWAGEAQAHPGQRWSKRAGPEA
jgi:DNA processing protein